MGLLTKVLFFPITGPVAGIKWSLGKVQQVVEEEITDDAPVKQDLMELQMRLELGEITDEEYVEGEVGQGEERRARPRLAARRRGGVTALDELLEVLPRTILVVGKGGVGKT